MSKGVEVYVNWCEMDMYGCGNLYLRMTKLMFESVETDVYGCVNGSEHFCLWVWLFRFTGVGIYTSHPTNATRL